MRDGVKLAVDLYFPVQLEGKLAVILIRTPYNKGSYRTAEHAAPRVFAGQGHIVAVQDTRGRFGYRKQR